VVDFSPADGQIASLAPREHANNFSPPPSRRLERYELRDRLREFSQVRRCKGCGYWMRSEVVGVRHSEALGAGFSGLVTCGSVWVCPVCSAKIMARRSVETGVLLLGWENLGGRHVMGTLTMRHHKGHGLAALWDALQAAWHSVIRARVWSKWKSRVGSPGVVKVVEVSYGDNGWHVHIHFVLLVAGGTIESDVAELAGWLLPKWQRALGRNGFDCLGVGQDLHLVDGLEAASQLGEYLTKQTAYGTADSLGRELFGSQSKHVRGFSRTVPHWRLAEDFLATGDLDCLRLWHEMERASHGRRQYSVSKGLRELMALGPEKSDEEIAREEAGDRDLVQITRAGWKAVLRANREGRWGPVRILEVMEAEGVDGLCQWLEVEGIEHQEVVSDGQEVQ
jgi:Replication protein